MGATSAGAIVVPIYQTNSPEECLWVISDSGACAIFVRGRGAARQDRRDPRPDPEHPLGDRHRPARRGASSNGGRRAGAARSMRSRSSSCASAAVGAPLEELEARRAGVRPEDPFTFIYTSGTTGPPKGCVLTHGNYRAMIRWSREGGGVSRRRGLLPVPPPRPLLRAADPAADVRPRRHARLLRRGHQADRPRAAGGQTDLPAVGAARVREDLHARPRRDRGETARRSASRPSRRSSSA